MIRFVSNLTGSSMLEIAVMSTVVPVCNILSHHSLLFSPSLLISLFLIAASLCFATLNLLQLPDRWSFHSSHLRFIYLSKTNFIIFDATVTPTKKNDHDNAVLGSKKLGNYMATLTVDFLFIVLPMLLIFTVSFLNQEIVIFAFNNYFLFSF